MEKNFYEINFFNHVSDHSVTEKTETKKEAHFIISYHLRKGYAITSLVKHEHNLQIPMRLHYSKVTDGIVIVIDQRKLNNEIDRSKRLANEIIK